MNLERAKEAMVLNVLNAYVNYTGKGDVIFIFLSARNEVPISSLLNERQVKAQAIKNEHWKYKSILDRIQDESEIFKLLNEFFLHYFISGDSNTNLETPYDKFFDKLWELKRKELDENIAKMRYLSYRP